MKLKQAGCRMQARANWENFARIAKFSLCIAISLHSEIASYSEISVPLFCVQTTPFLVFFDLYPHCNYAIYDILVFSPFYKAI